MKKKLLSLIIVLIVLFMTGCEGSSVNLYYSRGEESTVYYVEVKLSNYVVNRFNEDANDRGVLRDGYYLKGDESLKGTAYTIQDYVRLVGETVIGLVYVRTDYEAEFTFIRFRLEVFNEENTIFVQPNPTVEKSLFLYTVKNEAKNPFTPYYEEYSSAKNTEKCNTVMQILQNGKWDLRTIHEDNPEEIAKHEAIGWYPLGTQNLYRLDILPSLNDAFPLSASYDASQFETIFYFMTNYNLQTSGERLVDESGNYYYEFRSLFGTDSPIYYEYVRANSVGWNIVAISLGLLTVLIVYLYSKLKKLPKKPTPQESYKSRFPYDPFDESNGNNNGGGGNPFDGY